VFGGRRWTSDEDAAVRAGFWAGKCWREIAEALPDRTVHAIRGREETLGLKRCEAGKEWTADEDAAVQAGVRAGKSWKAIAEELPGRTWLAAKVRGRVLGLKQCEAGVPWAVDEDTTLRAGVDAGESWDTIAGKLPGRTALASKGRARLLGIEPRGKRVVVAWTEAEDEEVRAGMAAGETVKKIAERLPGRTLAAVKHRRTQLGNDQLGVSERWTEEEDGALREGFKLGKTWKEISKAFPGTRESSAEARGSPRLFRGKEESSSSSSSTTAVESESEWGSSAG
jgi:hypothetical protein